MTKPYIALIAFISLVASAFGASDLSDKVKEAENIKKQEKTISPDGKLWKRVPSYLADDAKLDDDLRNEMQEYLMNNKQVSLKDFSKARLLGNISSILLTDFNRRFGATPVNYQTKIANEREKIIYKIASDIYTKVNDRGFYACANYDDKLAMDVKGKVDTLNARARAFIAGDRKKAESDEALKFREQIATECRFTRAAQSLLTDYRIKGMREKYNSMMLKMIEDDRVNYDYLYIEIDTVDPLFRLKYKDFLFDVNGRSQKLILTKEQVIFIAENLLCKHREVFNLKDPYYNDDINALQGIGSIVNVSSWLREYNLFELNDKLLNSYFNDPGVMETLRQIPFFKEFREYLIKRPDFSKYAKHEM